MISKDQAFKDIQLLIERFEEQYDSYKKSGYNETLTRKDFIDPFFSALGWDMNNAQGFAEAYREVIHEDKIKISGAVKAPDYSFRLSGGKRLFFVEAKKPHVVVKDEIIPAYQIRRYGWSAKLPISIITDFEEFAVYDCTKKPLPADKASVARIRYITFRDYLKEFDFIYDTFSKEKVLKGSFDKFVASSANKKGTTTVDKEFLNSLDEWRTYLATSISWNNKDLDEDEINFVVQQTIDRLIFLRIAEDRSVEPYGNLKHSISSGDYYKNLFDIFQKADEKYNSGIFDFKKDKISKNIKVDNKVIKTIINELYYPESPYEFSVLSVEILGNAYEQFLGKQIRIDSAHRAKIEEKPEVRKAGGVYYTPQYIVEYIVKNTVGKLIEGKTPKEISEITIADIACGSGSFLLGAYQYLLDYHKDYYTRNGLASKGKKDNPLTPEGHLITAEKKRILLNNIYGVDIDVNAVEVTKLSLLLKCMEGETEASIASQMSLWHERVLPSLENNIKSGNSLIDVDYYESRLDFGEEKKIKPFNWQKAFPLVFKVNGFDAIIGNPPWVDLKGHPPEFKEYYFNHYESAENRINLYALFFERGLKLLNKKGRLGFIIPNSILFQSSYEKIRKYILEKHKIDKIIRLPDDVFINVKAETTILIIGDTKTNTECLLYSTNQKINGIGSFNSEETKHIDSTKWLNTNLSIFDIYTDTDIHSILNKIEGENEKLINICDFSLGITPYDKYKGHTEEQISKRVFHSKTKIDKTFKPLLEGNNVTRYVLSTDIKEFISYGEWLSRPREKRFFVEPRILIRQIISGKPPRIYAAYCDQEYYNSHSIFNLIVKRKVELDAKYILGIINSKLINYYHANKFLDMSKRLFQKILIQNCKLFPIHLIDFNNSKEKKIYESIIELVNKIINLYQRRVSFQLESKIDQVQSEIDFYEEALDKRIYELYELGESEIKIIDNF